MARRVRRLLRGGRVVDLAGGHGLLAQVLILLDDSSPSALVVDTTVPPSAARLQATLSDAWPRLRGRVGFIESAMEAVSLGPSDLVVSAHACGRLTDTVLDLAVAARAPVAVLPCCHDGTCDAGPGTGWVDRALAVDLRRADRIDRAGYRVWTQAIPGDITPKNRLLIGKPA